MNSLLARQISTLLVFLSVFLLILAIYLVARRRKTRLDERLADLSVGERRNVRKAGTSLVRESAPAGMARLFGWTFSGVLPEALGGQDVRLRLIRGGFSGPRALPFFVLLRVLLPVIFGAGAVLVVRSFGAEGSKIILYGLVFAALGFFLPDIVLYLLVERRKSDITLGLSDALDLMVVCVEAGLGLSEAILRVGNETLQTCPPLSKEFRMVNREMLAGVSRTDALKNLAWRTGVEDVKSLVALLIQTERLGTSIAKSLRVHADNLRIRRRHRAEERARKVAVKLVFPLVLFIFPTLLVIILGPAAIRLLQTLGDVAK